MFYIFWTQGTCLAGGFNCNMFKHIWDRTSGPLFMSFGLFNQLLRTSKSNAHEDGTNPSIIQHHPGSCNSLLVSTVFLLWWLPGNNAAWNDLDISARFDPQDTHSACALDELRGVMPSSPRSGWSSPPSTSTWPWSSATASVGGFIFYRSYVKNGYTMVFWGSQLCEWVYHGIYHGFSTMVYRRVHTISITIKR